jgi:hypothetical protein
MRFGDLKGWVEMDEVDYSELRPATYEEAVRYSEIQKRQR